MFRIAGLVLTVLLFNSSITWADDELEIPQGQPRVSLGVRGSGKTEFDNTTSTLSDRKVDLKLTIPFHTELKGSEDELISRWSLDYKISQHRLTTNLLNNSTDILAQQLMVSRKWISESKELYVLSLGGLHQKETSSSESKTYGQGLFLGTYHSTKDLIYIYGLFYGAEIEGRFILFPLLGLRTELATDWDLLAIFPLHVRLSHTISKEARLSFFLRPDSFRYDVANDGKYPAASQTLTLQMQRVKIGAQWTQFLDPHFLLQGELGFLGRQRVKILSGDTEQVSESAGAAGYFGVNASYQF